LVTFYEEDLSPFLLLDLVIFFGCRPLFVRDEKSEFDVPSQLPHKMLQGMGSCLLDKKNADNKIAKWGRGVVAW
jgi:hypothetical protein